MVDRTSSDTGRPGRALGRLLVGAGLVIAGLFVGTGVSAAATETTVLSPSSDTVYDTPAIDDPNGCRIG